jgi:hypothetical protein
MRLGHQAAAFGERPVDREADLGDLETGIVEEIGWVVGQGGKGREGEEDG